MSKSKGESEQRQIVRALAGAESDSFIAEVGNEWNGTAHRARFAIAVTPARYKRDVLISHLECLGTWLFTRVRESLIIRVEMGRRAELGRVERLSAWAEEDVAADLVSAIVAGTGEVELQHRDDLFGSVKTWLTVACSGWQIDLGQLLEWSAPAWTARRGSRDQTQELLQSCASLIGTQVDNAKSYAREHVMAGVFSEGFTGDAEKRKTISKKLKHKELDFSCWLDGSGLTPKQRECAELKFEYGLTVTEIGVHLRKSRKTIQEHLARADAKIAQSKNREVRARRRAKVKPGEIDSF